MYSLSIQRLSILAMNQQQQRVKARGTREEVWAGTARRTSGGLTKDDIMMNPRGKLVSIKQSNSAKARYPALKAKLCATLTDAPVGVDIPEAPVAAPVARPPPAAAAARARPPPAAARPPPVVVAAPARPPPAAARPPPVAVATPARPPPQTLTPLEIIRGAVEAHLGYGPNTPVITREQKRLYSSVFSDIRAQVDYRVENYDETFLEAVSSADYEGSVRKWRR